jgi:rhodanese-related sulfurtransferase
MGFAYPRSGETTHGNPGFPGATAGSDQHMTEPLKPEDARVPVASREMFVVDVRKTEDWNDNAERIPGSIHIAAEEIDSRLDEIPDDKKILFVCPDGELSAEVAERLDGDDREVVSLDGGVEAWRKESLLTQPSPDAAPPKDEDEPPHEEPGDEDQDEGGEADDDDDDEADDVEDVENGGDGGSQAGDEDGER